MPHERRVRTRRSAAARAAALAEADEAILRAALELLAENGYRALTMESVRERSGVGKATLYRRYGSKEELVAAAIVHLNSDIPLPEDTGSVAGDFAATAQASCGRGPHRRADADAAAAVARSSASRRCTRCSTSTWSSRAGGSCARSSSAPRRAARSARR